MASASHRYWFALFLLLLPEKGPVFDPVRARYYEAIASAWTEGLPTLIKRLDALAASSPTSEVAAAAQELAQALGILHPGLLPDQAARLQKLRSDGASSPILAKSLRRLEMLQEYYSAAARGSLETAVGKLFDPVFEGSPLALQARADAAFRMGDCAQAEVLAQQLIESNTRSPLLANTFAVLGFCDTYHGNALGGARNFQQALALSPLPTLYGGIQDYVYASYRFARATPGSTGDLFDEEQATRFAGISELKDPRSLIFHNGKFILVDREQVFTLARTGAVEATKAARDIEDIAASPSGKHYELRGDSLDPGTGTPLRLAVTLTGKERPLRKLRSLAVDLSGDVFLLDEEAGLLRGTLPASGSPKLTQLSPVRGHLVRTDRRGYLYVLGWDRRGLQILTRDGKPVTSLVPGTGGREPSIQYFCLDVLNHVFILDLASNAIQVFSVNEGGAGLEKVNAGTVPLDSRPQHRNLRVIAVAPNGELAATGKNEDHWVIFR